MVAMDKYVLGLLMLSLFQINNADAFGCKCY